MLHQSQLVNTALLSALAAILGSGLFNGTAADVRASVATLASCVRVLSSGLHGLILADAWACFGPLHAGEDFRL